MVDYFTYGSNMDKADLDRWCRRKGYPIITFLRASPAKLNGYQLSFNYYSISRNGGAANIMESASGCVYGRLIELEDDDIKIIRKKEGYPNYYDEIIVDVETLDSKVVQTVKTYKVVKHRERDGHQPPTKDYMQLIIKNAKKYNFPEDYIKFLESIKTK